MCVAITFYHDINVTVLSKALYVVLNLCQHDYVLALAVHLCCNKLSSSYIYEVKQIYMCAINIMII